MSSPALGPSGILSLYTDLIEEGIFLRLCHVLLCQVQEQHCGQRAMHGLNSCRVLGTGGGKEPDSSLKPGPMLKTSQEGQDPGSDRSHREGQ